MVPLVIDNTRPDDNDGEMLNAVGAEPEYDTNDTRTLPYCATDSVPVTLSTSDDGAVADVPDDDNTLVPDDDSSLVPDDDATASPVDDDDEPHVVMVTWIEVEVEPKSLVAVMV